MPYPQGQITKLVNGLLKAPELSGVTGLRILSSATKMPRNGSPPRIVIFPARGSIQNPRNKATASRDVERSLIAHIWGHDFDECEYIETLLVQALVYQAAGGDPLSAANATPGQFWQATDEEWEQAEDSNRQGEEVSILIAARHSLDKTTTNTKLGQVNSVLLQQLTTTLSVAMGVSDVVASVVSTVGFPPAGVITIDSEQMQYQAVIGNQLTGLVRGVNNTTPATHAQNATVTVTG